MFPLLRYFAITSAVALLAASVIVMSQYNRGIIHHAVEHSKVSNTILGKSLSNVIWPEFGPHLRSSPGLDREELRAHPMSLRVRQIIEHQIKGLPVFEVKIHNAQGRTMFSTDESQIGEDKSKSPGVISALSGRFASNLMREDHLSPIGNGSGSVHIVATYFPIMDSDGHPEAVLEFSRDMTHFMDDIYRTQFRVGVVIFVVFGLLYVVLLIFVRRAGTILKNQHQQILEQRQESAKNNQKLADEVGERMRAEEALRELNDDLEQRVAGRSGELREAQEDLLRKQRLADLGQLIGTVGHDLRNPLGVIRNTVSLIGEIAEEAGLDLKRPLERTRRNIGRCDNIIHDLLDHTRTGKLNLEITAVDTWLDGVLDEQTLPKGITLCREFAAAGVEVPLDADRFRRAIINLFDNACQAMAGERKGSRAEAERRLTVATRASDERVEVSFSDTGPGIPPGQIGKVFEPLFTTKRHGVGLGLPMVKQIMEQHSGGIEINSENGRGTCVTLWLPRPSAAEEAA